MKFKPGSEMLCQQGLECGYPIGSWMVFLKAKVDETSPKQPVFLGVYRLDIYLDLQAKKLGACDSILTPQRETHVQFGRKAWISMFECQDFAKHMKLLSEGTDSMICRTTLWDALLWKISTCQGKKCLGSNFIDWGHWGLSWSGDHLRRLS